MFKPQSLIRSGRTIVRIPIDAILPNPYQPRKMFPPESIEALAESIRRHGLLSPLLVRAHKDDQYILIAGERRLKALCLLQRNFAEAVILDIPDDECALIALVENLQREDLHFLDEAEACRRIINEYGITQERLAVSLSCSPSALANRLRLLKLPESVRTEIRRNGLSERHARALLKLEDEQMKLKAISVIAAQSMSVARAESYIRQLLSDAESKPQRANVGAFLNNLNQSLARIQKSGIPAVSERRETESQIVLTITIPK